MKTSTLLLALAAGGYVVYEKNKTGSWPWEGAVAVITGGSWTVDTYDAARTMGGSSSAASEADARAKAVSILAGCPACKVTITNPAGNVVYQVNA